MYEYYRLEKQEQFCMLSTLYLAIVPVFLQLYKVFFSPRSLQPLLRNFLLSFFAP